MAAGFTLVEFLLVAFILAVGLLGMSALQVATVRGDGGARTRMTAAALATSALEQVLAEARMVFQAPGPARRPGGPESPPGATPGTSPGTDSGTASGAWARKYTAPNAGPWVERFDRDGLPAALASAFYTLTLTRSAPSPRAAPPPLAEPWEFQATVAWAEGPSGRPGTFTLVRIIPY